MGERADNSPRWIVRRAAKAAMAGALCAAGARWVVRSMARRNAGGTRVLILSYHAPTADFEASARRVLPSLLVSTRTLRRQLQQLAREREIVSLDEACHRLTAPPSRSRASRDPDVAVVSFDDGYAGVHEEALDVLRDLRIPATVYVPTGFIGTRHRLAHDRLFATLSELRRRRLMPQAAGLPPGPQALLDACAGDGPGDTLDQLILRLPHDALLEVAAALERRLGMREEDLPDETRLMGWDDLRALRAADIDIGGHSVHHAVLANVSLARARAEVQGCRDDIATRLGEPPRHFAYPNGYHTPAVRRIVAESGFVSGVTTEDVENRRGDPFTLKRKTIWENSTLGATGYSSALAACNLDGVFGALGWQRPTAGERPDPSEEDETDPDQAAAV